MVIYILSKYSSDDRSEILGVFSEFQKVSDFADKDNGSSIKGEWNKESEDTIRWRSSEESWWKDAPADILYDHYKIDSFEIDKIREEHPNL